MESFDDVLERMRAMEKRYQQLETKLETMESYLLATTTAPVRCSSCRKMIDSYDELPSAVTSAITNDVICANQLDTVFDDMCDSDVLFDGDCEGSNTSLDIGVLCSGNYTSSSHVICKAVKVYIGQMFAVFIAQKTCLNVLFGWHHHALCIKKNFNFYKTNIQNDIFKKNPFFAM